MAMAIYKPGQGKYTRLLSAAGAGVITAYGTYWLWYELEKIRMGDNTIYVQAAVCLAVLLGIGGVLWWALNKASIADFMIATEVEMKKVNWPSRKEIIGSTWVVICGTLLMAGLLFVVDIGFSYLFQQIGILEGAKETVDQIAGSAP